MCSTRGDIRHTWRRCGIPKEMCLIVHGGWVPFMFSHVVQMVVGPTVKRSTNVVSLVKVIHKSLWKGWVQNPCNILLLLELI